ncbi:unnamed protein product [Urochloa decumbens]|uniref:Phylloplanin n=1 Tax=Urochloa decumbens TaxID=240449 RepID=A0ABC8Y822_9POAL
MLLVVVAAGQVPRSAAALLVAPPNNSSVLISGMVPCAAGNCINAATAPPFPYAGLQLVCDSKVMAGTSADGNGTFLFSLVNVAPDLLAAVLGNQCKVVVVTPLAACDKSLADATGTLTAPLMGIVTGSGGLDFGGLINKIILGVADFMAVFSSLTFSLLC